MLQKRVSVKYIQPVSHRLPQCVCRLERASAVVVIEKWWRVVKDRRVFNMLKQAICTSVSLT